ncbi:MAG TPA: aldo/keto reductase [Bacteroidales bacterium]|jgi:predicted aldo/keto reductase-like oxidoreductase|nr:aldo/keto reductase [Bacteroidales bacterium]HOX74355.1 aldo/keto reductase [Bacteroidales bacterium]HQM68014.1 aldo/keto reductase [Bacteroidales bacterium]
MENRNRRQFLKKSIIGLTGAAMVPGTLTSYASVSASKSTVANLPARVLGKTGIRTPLISFGTSGALDTGFIRSAYEAGIKMFFSATYYGEGKNEQIVGAGLKGLPRDSFIVGTAVPPDGFDNRTGTFPNGFDPDAYIKKAEGSLSRFNLDYVDFVLFPFAGKRETVLNEGVLKAMGQLKKQGKTRFIGIASHSDMEEALTAATDSKVYDVAMISYNYKTRNIYSLNSAVARAAEAGIGVVAMKTTAGVYNEKSGVQYNSDAILKWALQNENISSIVSGMSSLEQLQKNIQMIKNLKLSEQELKDLNLAGIESGHGLYCQQCRQCIPQCPNHLDIPTIMRSYMYAYGYRNAEQAWHTLADIDLSRNPCGNCETCKVNCLSSFDVKNKIMDIARLKDVPEDFIKT